VILVFPGNSSSIPLLVLLLFAVAAGLAAALLARLLPGSRSADARALRAAAREAGPRPARLARRLDPEAATGLALTVALAVLFAGGLVLGILALLVRHHDAFAGIDTSVADWGHAHASPASTSGLKVVTAFGETWMAVAVCVLVAAIDWRLTASRWTALFLLVVVAGDKLLTTGLKDAVDRVRPALDPAAAALGPSFPSGHTSTAAATWAAVALVACRWWGHRALAPLVGAAVGIGVGVAASRVLLDVHWLTDVLAGLALGWAWFAVCAIAFGGRLLRFGAPAEALAAEAGDRATASGSPARGRAARA